MCLWCVWCVCARVCVCSGVRASPVSRTSVFSPGTPAAAASGAGAGAGAGAGTIEEGLPLLPTSKDGSNSRTERSSETTEHRTEC